MEIKEKQVLEMSNLLSFRGRMIQQEFAAKSQEIEDMLNAKGSKKIGPVVVLYLAKEVCIYEFAYSEKRKIYDKLVQ